MENKKKKYCGAVLLTAAFCMFFGTTISATQSQIDDVKENIDALEEQKKNQEGQLGALENKKDALDEDASELDTQLAQVASQLTETQNRLEETGKAIEETKVRLEEARKQEQEQYENMKKRIRFIYENGGWSALELLLEAESFSEFLNESEYVASIQEYDREMLVEYQNTRKIIAQKEEELGQQQEELLALETQQEEQKNQVETLLNQTKEKIAGTENEIAQSQEEISTYQAKIKEQKEFEEQLEIQKAKEDAKRLEEIKRQEEELKKQKAAEEARRQEEQKKQESQNQNNQYSGGNTSNQPPSSQSDVALLAALIECEAGGESYDGMLAVGSVVMNRVRSSHFPNTVVGVIYQGGQFTPVASGRFASVLARGANSTCVSAANQVLSGSTTVDNLYFRRNTGAIEGNVIGNHVFY